MIERNRQEHRAKLLKPLMEAVHRKGLVVFAGAGVSVAPPASCPSWNDLKREILGGLMDKLEAEKTTPPEVPKLRPSVVDLRLRPEAFMLGLSEAIGAGPVDRMLDGLNSGEPNANHLLVAALAKKGVVKAIITTNFEQYFEKSLTRLGLHYHAIRDDAEVASLATQRDTPLILFKPHGCLARTPPRSSSGCAMCRCYRNRKGSYLASSRPRPPRS